MKRCYKKAVLTGFSAVMILGLSACAKEIPKNQNMTVQQNSDDEKTDGENEEEHSSQNENFRQKQSSTELFSEADLQGDVVDFSDSGFRLSAAENKGEELVQAAPGSEKEEDLIVITYRGDVAFEILTMDRESVAELSREDTDKQSIKKQTSVLVFGTCEDTYSWVADRVIIVRWK